MAELKKNKIHNPQFISDKVPESITKDDVGRIWVDNISKRFVIGVQGEPNQGRLVGLLTDDDKNEIKNNVANNYFSEIADVNVTIEKQIEGDVHFDKGYDFFSDDVFMKNATQELMDYYSFFYLEVENTNSINYIRTILTDSGEKHIRCATGHDSYSFNNQIFQIVNYSKIVLPTKVKGIIEIKFDNKDTLEYGFTLSLDMKTILIFGDPDGLFLNQTVKVRYVN